MYEFDSKDIRKPYENVRNWYFLYHIFSNYHFKHIYPLLRVLLEFLIVFHLHINQHYNSNSILLYEIGVSFLSLNNTKKHEKDTDITFGERLLNF